MASLITSQEPASTAPASIATPPDRRPHSIRRTLSAQCSFPDGPHGDTRYIGRARDLYTGATAAEAIVVDERMIEATLAKGREIRAFRDVTDARDLDWLRGLMPGRATREAALQHIGAEFEARSPMARLLEELPNAAFLASGSWFAWFADPDDYIRTFGELSRLDRQVEGLCISYAPGSIAVRPDGKVNHAVMARHRRLLAIHPSDQLAWHRLDHFEGPEFWRIRYIDIWRQDGRIMAATGFQDSAALQGEPDLRNVYHEYALIARIDPEEGALEAVEITPGLLPFTTCVAAPANAARLIGKPVAMFGKLAPTELAGVLGCTHLNEALKALQDAPALAARLRQLEGAG